MENGQKKRVKTMEVKKKKKWKTNKKKGENHGGEKKRLLTRVVVIIGNSVVPTLKPLPGAKAPLEVSQPSLKTKNKIKIECTHTSTKISCA